jgi:hypothetical protein
MPYEVISTRESMEIMVIALKIIVTNIRAL